MQQGISDKKGFTLVEMLTVMAIMAILFAIVTPASQHFIMNARLAMQRDGLANALNLARNTALNQGFSAWVCPFSANNSTTCGANWNSGFIVVGQLPRGDSVLLHSAQAKSPGPVLSATGGTMVTFTPQGLTGTQFNFTLCDTRGSSQAQSVEVLPTGFVHPGSTAGVAVWGGALACP